MRTIIFNGRIAKDAEKQVSKNGHEFVSILIANNEYNDPRDSEGKQMAMWFRVTSFQSNHLTLLPYLTKGKAIMVMGSYSSRLYQSQKDGRMYISHDVLASDISFELSSQKKEGGTSNTETVKTGIDNAMGTLPQQQQNQETVTIPSQPNTQSGMGAMFSDDFLKTRSDDDLPF